MGDILLNPDGSSTRVVELAASPEGLPRSVPYIAPQSVAPSRHQAVIRATLRHPFYVRDKGFVPAADLKPGDELRTADSWVPVVETYRNGDVEPVFNFCVEDWHTYFAGGVLVHNDSGDGGVLFTRDNGLPVFRGTNTTAQAFELKIPPAVTKPNQGPDNSPTGVFKLTNGDFQQRAVGVIDYTPEQLTAMGVSNYSVSSRQRRGYSFGGDQLASRLGLTPGQYTMKMTEFVAADGSRVPGVMIRNKVTGEGWYGVPEVVNTSKDGSATGTVHIGYTFYNRMGDVNYNLSGGERLKLLKAVVGYESAVVAATTVSGVGQSQLNSTSAPGYLQRGPSTNGKVTNPIDPKTLKLPPGMRNPDLGELVNWSTRSVTKAEAMEHTRNVIQNIDGATLSRFREAGLTKEMAQQWASFYRGEAFLRPSNQNAEARAVLMQAIADML